MYQWEIRLLDYVPAYSTSMFYQAPSSTAFEIGCGGGVGAVFLFLIFSQNDPHKSEINSLVEQNS